MLEWLLRGLVLLHVVSGFSALGAGIVAAANKVFDWSHRRHVVTGRIFFYSMAGVFLTAVPLSVIRSNVFLLLIAWFSFYLAFSGWCYARNRSGVPTKWEWAKTVAMLLGSVVMAAYGLHLIMACVSMGIAMCVFAVVSAALAGNDFRNLRSGGVTGKRRIANHLTMMLAGLIATLTAFLVVNVSIHPMWVLWLAPTALMTPLIVWMNLRVQR